MLQNHDQSKNIIKINAHTEGIMSLSCMLLKMNLML